MDIIFWIQYIFHHRYYDFIDKIGKKKFTFSIFCEWCLMESKVMVFAETLSDFVRFWE